MKKFFVSTLATLVLVSFGSVFAQPLSVDHDLRVTIPEVVMIRVVPVVAGAADVVFDYANLLNQATYFAALESVTGDAWLPATSHNLADVQVLAVGTGWRVTVGTLDSFTTTAIGLDDVRVSPTGLNAVALYYLNTATDIADGDATIWQSLGISGADYELYVDGTEDAGDDLITVTYSIFAN